MKAIKDFLKGAAMLSVGCAVLSLPVACTAYRYQDCKKVGHTTLYCVMNIAR